MYIPAHLELDDQEQQLELIRQYPLGTLFSHAAPSGLRGLLGRPADTPAAAPGGMCATHIPFHHVTDAADPQGNRLPRGRLIAHLARNNPHAEMLEQNANCMVVFQTADSYVSPEWYPLKPKTHRFVPTWDFGAVHVYGTARIIRDDKEWLLQMLNAITDQEEQKRPQTVESAGQEAAVRRWSVGDTEPRYLENMLKNIVGIEITITEIQAKVKFEQDQPPVNAKGVLEGYARELDPGKAEKLTALTRAHYKRPLD